ncbi:MAG: hypothetical protein Q7U10_07980 [Thermodesulfovibrionia bacterium]|nr:hypothetical protein [Thermodesulfovibrionia bacterium]
MAFFSERLYLEYYPAISREEALRIAIEKCGTTEGNFEVMGSRPEVCSIYGLPNEPCWFVRAPWNDGEGWLRSSRIIVISKATGKVFYDGDVGDEG